MQNKTRNHDTAVIGAIRFSVSTSLRLPRSCCLNLSGNPASLVPAASPGLSPGCFPSSASSLINTGCSHHIPLTPAGDASPAGKQSIPFSPSQQIHQESPRIHEDRLLKVSEEVAGRAAAVAHALEMQPHAKNLAPAIRPHPAWQGQKEPLQMREAEPIPHLLSLQHPPFNKAQLSVYLRARVINHPNGD